MRCFRGLSGRFLKRGRVSRRECTVLSPPRVGQAVWATIVTLVCSFGIVVVSLLLLLVVLPTNAFVCCSCLSVRERALRFRVFRNLRNSALCSSTSTYSGTITLTQGTPISRRCFLCCRWPRQSTAYLFHPKPEIIQTVGMFRQNLEAPCIRLH